MKVSFFVVLAFALIPLVLSWVLLYLRSRKRAKAATTEEHVTFMGDMSAFHRTRQHDQNIRPPS
jgi:hypothetical protein